MANKYLDYTGLSYFWGKLKTFLGSNYVSQVSGKGLSTNDYTTTEKNKLAGIATGAEVNQNAFSNIKVGSTTVAADSKTDTLELVAGSNITLTPDATNDKVTIAASNANYDDLINKPTIPSALSDLQEDSTHRLVTNDQITSWTAKSDFSGSYTDLTNKPTIPTTLSQLTEDNSHRTVSDAEKSAWNAKYNKSTSGIPMSDLSDQVQTLLRSIGTDTATFTDEIIIGDVRFKRYSTKRLMITDVES